MKNRKTRKILALVLTLALVVTSIPSVFFDTVSAATGPSDGQIEYVGGSASANNPTYDLDVSKTIEEVEGKENYFDITLKATTHRHTVDMSTDVVIVMDISNTMNSNPVSGSGTKLDQAKAATNQFIEQFANDTKLSNDRRVSVVTFNQNAQVVVPLTEANDANDYTKNFKTKVEAIKAPTEPVEIKFTNIEGGLQLAKNILAQSDAAYKFVVLLTDGFPTTYVSGNRTSTTKVNGYDTYMSHATGTSTYSASKVGKKANGTLKSMGYMANVSLKKMCLYGVDYSDYAAQRAQILAKELKDSGANIFSVGIGIGGMTIQGYLNAHKNKEFSTVDTNGMGANYTIGSATDTASYKTWLGSTIAGGNILSANGATTYAPGDSATQLKVAYTKILKTIEQAPATTMREFYTMDPMSEVADFISFYDKDGNLSATPDQLVGESKKGAENTAVFGGTGNENRINWNMLASGYTMDGENLVYTLKYRVRLTNEQSGFKWETAYKMNDTTKLYYSQKYVDNGDDVPNGTGEVEYPIPETEGYKGSIKFKKIDGETNEALKNIEFTLKHYGDSCSVCGGDAVIADRTMKTDASGYIEFDNIPSGHEYYLSEQAMDEYAPIHDHTIVVSYGDTYVGTKAAENKVVDGTIVSSNKAYTIANTKKEPVEIQIQATKKMAESVPSEGEFKFQIKGNFVDGAEHHEIVSNDGKGNIKFSKMVFDQAGEYTFEISEVVGTDSNTIYDTTKHVVKIVVSDATGGAAYQAKVYVNGTLYATYVGKDNVIETVVLDGTAGYAFYNKSRADGVATLKANKAYTDGTLAAGDFTFKVTAITDGAPMPAEATAKNDADGNVTFGEIKYNTPGTYEYEIAEVKGNDKSIVYDLNKYKAVVTVTAPADLTSGAPLQTSVKYYDTETNEEIDAVTFTNKDRKIPEITMKGLKTFNGKVAESGDFTFVIQEIDDEGKAIGEATEIKNGDNGIIDFDSFLESEVKKMIDEVDKSATSIAISNDYKIYEKAGTDSSVEYDDRYYVLELGAMAREGYESYELTAVMYKVDGEKTEGVFHAEYSNKIQITDGSNALLVKFENTSTVELNLKATKKLESKDTVMNAGDYTFVLEGKSGKLQEVKNDKDGNVKFDAIEFGAADVGTHKFVVYEVEGDDQGLFYDDSLYTVSVTVSMDKNGNLSITKPEIIDEYDKTFTEMEFVNKDMDPTHLHLNAQKTVNGAMPTAAQQFNFQLIDANTNTVIETIHNVHGTIAFSAIELTEKGTYNYVVKEVLPVDDDAEKDGIQKDGFTYDETEHKIQVVVTDADNNGVLEKKVTVNGKEDPAEHNTVTAGIFENPYETEPVSVALGGSKVLTDHDLTAGEFSFTIAAVTADAPMPANTTVKNDENGNFEFDKIKFEKEGTYEYTISEVMPAEGVTVKDGITYDTTVYNVKVVVTDNGKGELVAKKTVNGSEDTAIKFENDYDTQPTSLVFVADKTLSGRTLQAGEFSFKLVEVDADGNAIKGTEQTVKNGTSAEVGKVYFDSITYDKAGTHTYKVSEVIPADQNKLGGVTYDETVYTVTVNVTDNGKGQLIASVDGKEVNTYTVGEFKNKYDVTDVAVNPEVTKVLNGRAWKEGDSFSFTLAAAGDVTKDAVANGTVKLAGTNVTIDYSNAEKKAQFGDITFTAPGVYYFAINETAGAIEDVKYDSHTAFFRVTVTDNNKGSLVANTYYRDTTTFTNTYVPTTPVTVSLKADKNVEVQAGTYKMKEGDFQFGITPAASNPAADPVKHKIVNSAADGSAVLVNAEYTKPGTYVYTVNEIDTEIPGMNYDDSIYAVTVVVTKDTAKSALTSKVTITKDGNNADAVVFNNTYNPADTTATIHGHKILESGYTTMQAGEFQFQLKAVTAGAPMPAGTVDGVATVTNSAAGVYQFGTILYDHVGEYVYQITEVKGNNAEYEYDDTVYTVKVNVTDQNGALIAHVENNMIAIDDDQLANLFVNKYKPSQTTCTIEGTKTLEGRNLAAGEFTFTMEAVTAGAPMPATTEVTNDAQGKIEFGEIEYSTEGTYEYLIKEKAGSVPGVKYDSTVVKATVTVKYDAASKKLVADVNYDKAGASGFVFANVYDAAAVDVSIDAVKTVTAVEGNTYTMKAGNFQFEIEPADFNPASDPIKEQYVTHDENGNIEINATYTEPGTYMYTMHEASGEHAGMIFDDTVYHIEVVVTDDIKTGKLTADVNVTKNGSAVDNIVFNNTYDPHKTSAEIHGHKHLQGKDLEEGEFSFAIEAVTAGAPMPAHTTVKNMDTGIFQFDTIVYETPGVYEYVVYEVNEGKDRVTYDDSKYNVTVTVVDENGVLNATVDGVYTGDKEPVIVFNNTYEPAKPHLNIEKMQSVNGGEATKDVQIVEEGDVITYYVRVWSDGECAAEDLVIKDSVPEGLKLITESLAAEGGVLGADGKTITWTIDKLEVGEDATVTFQVEAPIAEADKLDADGYQHWYNIASVSYGNNPENPGNPDDPSDPSEPGVPDEPRKDIPSNEVEIKEPLPEEPTVPTEPEEPTKPEDSEDLEEPEDDVDGDGGTQTGDDFNTGLYGFLALAALAVAGAAFRRKTTE